VGVVGRNRDIYLFLRESSPIAFFLDMGQGGASGLSSEALANGG